MGSPEMQEPETAPHIHAGSNQYRLLKETVYFGENLHMYYCLLHFWTVSRLQDMGWITLVFCAHLDVWIQNATLAFHPGATRRLCATSHHAGSTALLAQFETQ